MTKWLFPWVKALFMSFAGIVPPPAVSPPCDFTCKATTVGGAAGNPYRRYCRRVVPHDGKKQQHRDGDYVWSD